jgi:crooked neck
LEKLPKDKSEDIYKAYTIHEKKHGDKAGIETIISNKRKIKYEEVKLMGFKLILKEKN